MCPVYRTHGEDNHTDVRTRLHRRTIYAPATLPVHFFKRHNDFSGGKTVFTECLCEAMGTKYGRAAVQEFGGGNVQIEECVQLILGQTQIYVRGF